MARRTIRINPERQERKSICLKLGITMKRLRKLQKKYRGRNLLEMGVS